MSKIKWPQLIAFFALSLLAIAPARAGEEVGTEATPVPVVNEAAREVRLAGAVAKQGRYAAELQGAVEYLATCPGGKDYESIFVCPVVPTALKQALERLGLEAGQAAGEDTAPSGDRLTITVEWAGADGPAQAPAERFILDAVSGEALADLEWVFTGSRSARDPDTGREVLMADLVQNLISLHLDDASVLIQNPHPEARAPGRWRANRELLPPAGTAVTLVFSPVLLPAPVPAPTPTATPAPAPAGRRRLIIHGRVQGVGFRAFTQRHARRLGLAGWVRNRGDGTVELVVQADEESVDALAAFRSQVARGPRGARVDRVEEGPAPPGELSAEFVIRPTVAENAKNAKNADNRENADNTDNIENEENR